MQNTKEPRERLCASVHKETGGHGGGNDYFFTQESGQSEDEFRKEMEKWELEGADVDYYYKA